MPTSGSSSYPPTIPNPVGSGEKAGVFGRSHDPAKYVVGRARFTRPTLAIPDPKGKGLKFEWPVGVEGFRVAGQIGLAQHLYLGDNAPVVTVVHREARRIEMSGVFPGITGAINMRDLLAVMTAVTPTGYWTLSLPAGIFPKEQQVVIEDYEFNHPEDDATDSFFYTIRMVRTGVGKKVKKTKKTKSPVNPVGSKKKPTKGSGNRIFVTKAGGNTLRAIAKLVYNNTSRWTEIWEKNQIKLAKLNVPKAELAYRHLPYGMRLHY